VREWVSHGAAGVRVLSILCVCVRERERESVCVCVSVCKCVMVFVIDRLSESLCCRGARVVHTVCVCV